MKKVIALLGILAFSVPAYAEKYNIDGWGAAGCGKWVQYHTGADDVVSDKIWRSRHMADHWVMGGVYVSGYYENKLKKTDVDSMVLFVTNYCKANPLHKVHNAVNALIVELRVDYQEIIRDK
ncbi:MAG: hypothetical protein U9P00_05975 [Pseudomonadota bacterium]|nr:hypothetical protein [Pseudomonadota bacterium]